MSRSTWYPTPPPSLPGETDDAYTNRLTGADGTGRNPYNHHRLRECALGYHNSCSGRASTQFQCPHHADTGPGTEPAQVVVNGADILARLWYLPVTTAQRVMAEAHDIGVDLRLDEATGESLRRRIDTLYNTTISDGFLTDVAGIYANVRDKLRRSQ